MDSNSNASHNNLKINRHTDIHPRVAISDKGVLPPVNWAGIGQSAPVPLPIESRKAEDPLPDADVVILTWTSAEWRALDHVFLNSATESDSNDKEWIKGWLPYTRGASAFPMDPKYDDLWGSFRLVRITDRSRRPWRVLLFKSNSHLAHPPWIAGLTAMLRSILKDTKPDRIYTIGTAGGTRLGQRLGDSIITNAALLDLQLPQNTGDPGNGNMYRCPTWFPVTSMIGDVESNLLYRMNQIVTDEVLESLFEQLRAKNPDDYGINDLKLSDLLNDSIRPELLGEPKVRPMKDVPLFTTDYYFIADGVSDVAYSFAEMDDAVIAREANRLGVRFVCVRNISDTAVSKVTENGTTISEAVRGDWSSLIYSTFGLQTSYNGALATWSTIAGEGRDVYDPVRETAVPDTDDPLEVKLAFQVRSCGTCSFFWPEEKSKQPYGPYTAFDFELDVPNPAKAIVDGEKPSPWITGRTRPPSFPNGEVVDGCRKAPIMTIGINPNLTAFLPGQNGAAWCYPDFSSDNGTDAWAKYAWYYRYRSVYQERLTLDFIKKFILPEGKVIAPRDGCVVSTDRPDDSPAWSVKVRYDGDKNDTTIPLPGKLGEFPYMLLNDTWEPNNKFNAGDVIAGRVAVPQGIRVEVMQDPQVYYMQFVPVLQKFENTLQNDGHAGAFLRVGEDVCQLDMVACASPHWKSGFLGGTDEDVDEIVNNCVTQNAWAIKQMVQTRPAVLYVVSESSWKMFHDAFGRHVQPQIPEHPVDNDFTLLRATTDPNNPHYIKFDVTVDGQRYVNRTRLVITPHFSYGTNFRPQFRLSSAEWESFKQTQPDCFAALTEANGFTTAEPDPDYSNDYFAVQLSDDAERSAASLALLEQHFPAGYKALQWYFYDPHAMMASVLDDMYSKGELSWKDEGHGAGYLDRTEGSCQFCVNKHWQFPNECRYDKPNETPAPPDFLEKVAEKIVATGKPVKPPG